MDQELIAYFDARFRETAQQIAESREETAQQIAKFREETAQQIAESYEENAQQIAKFREETTWRFEQIDKRLEKREEAERYTHVLVEGLRHELHLVAETVLGVDEKLDRYRTEARVEFNQVKGWIEPYYRELDGRVRNLDNHASRTDGRIEGLDDRLQVLENRAERQQGDVMDAIRKMLGKPPLPPPVTSE